MRLSIEKAEYIVSLVQKVREDAQVFLFGSRAYDQAKGGDIDILILSERKLDFLERGRLESSFWKRFGQQKIDFVSFTKDDNHPFKRIALKDAILLG